MVKQAEDLRRTLLDASLALIEKDGLERFSMREVARRAGVSHQAPYHYFPDREAILAAIVTEGFERLTSSTRTAVARAHAPRARLKAIGEAYVRFALNNPAHFRLMFRSEWVRMENHQEARAAGETAFDVLVNAVHDLAQEIGVASSEEELSALVMMCWSLAHGFATLSLEGKLNAHCGKTKRAHLQASGDVFGALDVLLKIASKEKT